jgi:hypothetical protein
MVAGLVWKKCKLEDVEKVSHKDFHLMELTQYHPRHHNKVFNATVKHVHIFFSFQVMILRSRL